MNNKINECFQLLKYYRNKLNKQQYRTLKGQILSGDLNGFKKGLFKLTRKNNEIKENEVIKNG